MENVLLRLLRQMFHASGWTQARLARSLQISDSDMSNIIHGRRPFSVGLLRRAAKALGYKVCITVAPTASGTEGVQGKPGKGFPAR